MSGESVCSKCGSQLDAASFDEHERPDKVLCKRCMDPSTIIFKAAPEPASIQDESIATQRLKLISEELNTLIAECDNAYNSISDHPVRLAQESPIDNIESLRTRLKKTWKVQCDGAVEKAAGTLQKYSSDKIAAITARLDTMADNLKKKSRAYRKKLTDISSSPKPKNPVASLSPSALDELKKVLDVLFDAHFKSIVQLHLAPRNHSATPNE